MSDPFPQEASQRMSQLAGVKLAGAAVGLKDHLQMLNDYRQRVRESHELSMGLLGKQTDSPPEDGQMGDIVITGDIQHTEQKPEPKKGFSPLVKTLAAAAAIGAGTAPLTYALLQQRADTTNVIEEGKNYGFGLLPPVEEGTTK